MGAHILAIKDMAGLCQPYAAQQAGEGAEGRDRPADPLPHARHERHQRRARSCARATRASTSSIWRIASMSGTTQPAEPELDRRRAAAHAARHRTRSRRAQRVLRLLGAVREFYAPFDTAPKTRQRRGLPARDARRPVHEPEGAGGGMGLGHRWPEIARTYAEVNQLFGDIVKVTPIAARSSATWRCSCSPAASSRPTW